MDILNAIPLAALVYFFYVAFVGGHRHDIVDNYFQKERKPTGKRFHNLFGIPNDNLV